MQGVISPKRCKKARDDCSFLCYNGILQFCVSCWWNVWSKSRKSICSSLCLFKKNSDRDVKAHLKFCNIVTDAESVNSEENFY